MDKKLENGNIKFRCWCGNIVLHAVLEKRPFVPVGNPHLYQVSNRYKPSGTNVVKHLYRTRYPVQMPHICTGQSLDTVQICPHPPTWAGRGGDLYRVEVPHSTNDCFLMFFFSLTYLLKVLILIVIRYNIKSCGI
jgi:hypothetical protein